MEKYNLVNLIGATIRLRTKDGFYYRGKLVDVSNESIQIDDIKIGRVILALSEISSVQMWQDDRGKTK